MTPRNHSPRQSTLCIHAGAYHDISTGGACSRTSHRTMTSAERERAGIRDGLARVSVGIEDIEDLLGDFDQAMLPP